jgi:hypothetical protein
MGLEPSLRLDYFAYIHGVMDGVRPCTATSAQKRRIKRVGSLLML